MTKQFFLFRVQHLKNIKMRVIRTIESGAVTDNGFNEAGDPDHLWSAHILCPD